MAWTTGHARARCLTTGPDGRDLGSQATPPRICARKGRRISTNIEFDDVGAVRERVSVRCGGSFCGTSVGSSIDSTRGTIVLQPAAQVLWCGCHKLLPCTPESRSRSRPLVLTAALTLPGAGRSLCRAVLSVYAGTLLRCSCSTCAMQLRTSLGRSLRSDATDIVSVRIYLRHVALISVASQTAGRSEHW